MALTFTRAGLQTALDAVNTAVQAGDRATAYAALVTYTATYSGLRTSVSGGGVTSNYPTPDALRAALDAALNPNSAGSVASDRRRLIRTGLRHGR